MIPSSCNDRAETVVFLFPHDQDTFICKSANLKINEYVVNMNFNYGSFKMVFILEFENQRKSNFLDQAPWGPDWIKIVYAQLDHVPYHMIPQWGLCDV